MVSFREMYGAVYVLENAEAQRVKIGMTINHVVDRLNDVNDKWIERKGICQICGVRLVVSRGRMPKHVLSGKRCEGGDQPALENDVSLSERHLGYLRSQANSVSGSEKGSLTRKISTLEKRINQYRNHVRPVGSWSISTVYYTECAEKVELLTHELLAEFLDGSAPFGEVFTCSVPFATEAVETVLRRLQLLESARKTDR